MKRDDIFNRVAAVLIAIFLWVYVINVVNPPTTVTVHQVPVLLQNQEYLDNSKLAIAGDGKYTVDVVLSGKRMDLIVSPSDLTATADLNGLKPGQNYITVRVVPPHNTTVQEIRTEQVQVYVDELITVAKRVEVDVTGVASGTELSALSLQFEEIKVSGAKSLVNMVDHLTLRLDASEMRIDEPQELKLPLTPMDAEGNTVDAVNLERAFVDLGATLYNVKSVPLYTRVEGSPGFGVELLSSNIPSVVNVKGKQTELAKINSIEAEPLDIEGITESAELAVVPVLPQGVELSASNDVLIALFTLSEYGSVQREADSSEIVLEGLPEGFTIKEVADAFAMDVTIRGSVEDIMDLPEDAVAFYVDLSEISEGGEFDLPILGRSTDEKKLEVSVEPALLHLVIKEDAKREEDPQEPDKTQED